MKAVLIVEDERLIQLMLADVFEDAGFEVLLAGTPAAGAELIRDHGPELGALITDVNLGPPGAGWEVARAARAAAPGLPVVYITGDSAQEWRMHAVADSALVLKPFAPSDILRAVTAAMEGRFGGTPTDPG